MSFDDVRFPVEISRGAVGGPERRTDIVTLASGFEERNQTWADSRRRYDAGYGVNAVDQLHAIIEFFEARRGRQRGFRWKDWTDFKSCAPGAVPTSNDQAIGTGTGALATFQLVKVYSTGSNPYTRTITKPVSGTVKVRVAGVEKTEGVHFTVNHATGIVTFTGGNIPGSSAAVRAGFEFDTPVRFDTDRLQVNLAHFFAGSVPQIPLIEVRL